jgi:hypothetical protein
MKKLTLIAFIVNVFAVQSQNWTTALNSGTPTPAPKIGLSTNHPLSFHTNNALRMTLDGAGKLILRDLIGTGERLVKADATGKFISFPAGTASQVLYGNGSWGNLPPVISSFSLTGTTGNYSLSVAPGTKFGIGTTSPKTPLDVSGDGTFSGNLKLLDKISLSDNFKIEYVPATAGVPNIFSSGPFSLPRPSGARYKAPCTLWFKDPTEYDAQGNAYSTIWSPPTANFYYDLMQVYESTQQLSVLSMGIYNGDGVIALEPFPFNTTNVERLKINPTCPNDVFICEGGGYTKIFNSAGVVGDLHVSERIRIGNPTFGLQSSFEVNTKPIYSKALTISNPALLTTNKTVFEVASTGRTEINTANIDAFVVKDGTNAGIINFKVKNTGYVYAREINVMPVNITFPDYVFASNYKLRSIENLENYIVTNKHLPNIPSAKEVSENGINLADMQVKQMEKIEEAFLYIIQLKKENDALKERLKTLEKKH